MTILDSTNLDPTEPTVEIPHEPPAPPASPWARCAPARILVPVVVTALALGGIGGFLVDRAGSERPQPAVETQGRGDVVDDVSFEDEIPDEDFFDESDEGIGWSTGETGGTDDPLENFDSISTDEPPSGGQAEDPTGTIGSASPTDPEAANEAPTFDHVTVSTRSRRALASFAAKDGDGTIARVVVDWGDGSAVQVLEPATETAEHRYDPMLGNRFHTAVHVTAYDDDGAFVSASRAIDVVALQRVQITDLRLMPRSDCFDVLVDLRLAGKASLSGAMTTVAEFRETLRHGESAVVLASTRSDDRPVDEGFSLTTGVLVDSSVHAPVTVRKTITDAGKYALLIRLVHDDDNTKKCTIDAIFSVTTVAV